jgi:hypothetical protein
MAKKLEGIEGKIASRIVDEEVARARVNMQDDHDDYEAVVDLIENERTEKDYDWMSNISLPEYASHFLTQAADDANTYFSTRDFVEVYIQDESPEAKAAAKANKDLINKTLNQRHINHYEKYMRAKLNNNSFKSCVARCWWEQEWREGAIGTEVLVDEFTGEPYEEDVIGDIVSKDRFNWDVVDPRNVFYDNTYAYTLQDKKWVTIRYEKTLAELRRDTRDFRYINLDQLEDIKPPEETETSRESYNKYEDWNRAAANLSYDIYERHGLEWCIVDRDENGLQMRDEYGNPTSVSYGYDINGDVLAEAELHELIVTVAVSEASRVLIRFQPQPYLDAEGNPYRPLIRGVNYIHISKDGGIGDAKYNQELSMAMNDTLNMSNDRVKLSTLPTLKGNKYALEDNETVYFAPEHVIELFNTDDLEEFKISSDISGAVQMMGLFRTMLQQVNAKAPPQLGGLPELASTTATAVAGSEQHSNSRNSYRSLTWEYTFLRHLYWMVTHMFAQFAQEETVMKMMGSEENLIAFNPNYDYFYKPVTGTIETEYSKANKIREATTLLGYVMQSPNPKAPIVANMLLAEIFETWGKEKEKFVGMLLDEESPVTEQSGPGDVEGGAAPVSNQNVIPMSGMERNMRGI